LIQGTGVISHTIIDQINILEATRLAWEEAISQCLDSLPLDAKIGILIDGNTVPYGIEYPHQAVIKGDDHHLCIALASIYAKVSRDNLMKQYHQDYPEYQFDQHKGYGTPYHIQAIHQYGLSPIHRVTFSSQFISI
jgi:ribonuclease HII